METVEPTRAPTGNEPVHTATNDAAIARQAINQLDASGKIASGWDNEAGSWFITPEVKAAVAKATGETTRH